MGKILDALRGSSVQQILSAGLMGLKTESDDVYGRAVAFVARGDGPELLAELAGRDTSRAAKYLHTHGDPTGSQYWTNVTQVHKSIAKGWSIEKGSKARGDLYAKEGISPEVLSRLGRLFAAINPETAGSPFVPEWLAALVNDAMCTEDITLRRYNAKPNPERRSGWGPENLAAIALAGGAAEEQVPAIVMAQLFDRQAQASWRGDPFQTLVRIDGVEEYLCNRAATAREIIPEFKAGGKVGFLDFALEHPRLRDELADLIAALATDPAKTVRVKAISVLGSVPPGRQVEAVEPLLTRVTPARLTTLVAHALGIDGGAEMLARAAAREKPGKRKDLLENAVTRSQSIAGAEAEPSMTPELPPYEPVPEVELGEQVFRAVRAAIDAQCGRLTSKLENLQTRKDKVNTWEIDYLKREIKTLQEVSDTGIRHTLDFLSGKRADWPAKIPRVLNERTIRPHLGALTLLHQVRLTMSSSPRAQFASWELLNMGADLSGDLRPLEDALRRSGDRDSVHTVARMVFSNSVADSVITAEGAWPFFAEHPGGLEEVLGIRASTRTHRYGEAAQIDLALRILAAMPSIPSQYLPVLTDLSLGEAKMHRLRAQKVLEGHASARALAEHGLTDSKAEIRATAAAWLARLGGGEGIEPLTIALKREKREVAKAAMLAALEELGSDISPYLSMKTLMAEAEKGLKAKPPASLSWFPFDALPTVHTESGRKVPPEVIRWWVILAVKLKNPSGNGLLARYVSLLAPKDRRRLGTFALDAWVGQDTRHPEPAESRAHAAAEAQSRYDQMQRWYKKYPQFYEAEAAKTVEQHYQDLYREHQSIYLGSAIADKGLLALTVGMSGTDLARVAQTYFKTHTARRAQIDALVTALAANGEPGAVQLLLAVSRRFKQKTVQAHAAELVADLAERRGWTGDQLADRTVSTAGFDDDGVLRLDLGSRTYTGRVTDSFTLELSNDTGKVVKALPAARATDDPAVIKEAKAQLAASRKELKLVVAQQTSRLFEAMCLGRTWPVAEWQEHILGHPLMARLAEHIVWVEIIGEETRLFRPAGAGTLIDADDEDVVLADDCRIGIAHACTMAESEVDSWRTHLADYEVSALFDQLEAPTAPVASGSEVDDHEGWLSDSFTIRGRATKLGYSRGHGEDGGWFSTYWKSYDSMGLIAVIHFTGSMLPEENIPAAVTTMSFYRGRQTYYFDKPIPLSEVPPVLYAETYRDYVNIASGGQFDPDWQKKSEW